MSDALAAKIRPIQFLITSPVVSDKMFDNASSGKEREAFTARLLFMLEALSRNSQFFLQSHPTFPLLYEAGVKYIGQDYDEKWQDAFTTLTRKGGDCEDLSTWRIAELRERFSIRARPFVTWRVKPTGGYLYHALVWRQSIADSLPPGVRNAKDRPDILRPGPRGGYIEDPSRVLGMGKSGA